MKSNLSIRIHARAGQGSKTIAQFIAEAAAKSGKYVQAFPYYGPARAGAPMDAYVRISDHEIRVHSPIKEPNILVILDDTLFKPELNINKDQALIINTNKPAEQFRKDNKLVGKVYALDASDIAMQVFGKDFANTAMLGALAKIADQVDVKVINQVVKEKFSKKLGKDLMDKNIKAIKKGYDAV